MSGGQPKFARIGAVGQVRMSETAETGGAAQLVARHRAVFEKYLGDLHAEALDVEIGDPLALSYMLAQGMVAPARQVPEAELPGAGDSYAWEATLTASGERVPCWVVQNAQTDAPFGTVEVLAEDPLQDRLALKDRDPVELTIYAGSA